MIPKIIHTCYFSKSDNIPIHIKQHILHLEDMYPEYAIKLWTMQDCLKICENTGVKLENYTDRGVIGLLYLSYIFRFYIIDRIGGFYIDWNYKNNHLDLNQYENDKYVFEINGYNNISCDFFGGCAATENVKASQNIMRQILDVIGRIEFINKDCSSNLYNPNEIVANVIKRNDKIFDDNFIKSDLKLDNIRFLLNLKKQAEVYDVSKKHPVKSSIVIPIYNSEQYLNECLDSIFNQTDQDFEIICVDDGSTDDTKNIIDSYNDDRIVYIKKNHTGIVDSLNIGFKAARGKYIIRHDSDDVMFNDRLEYQTNFMESHPEVDLLNNGYHGFSEDVSKITRRYGNPAGYVTLDMLRKMNHLAHPCTCFRRKSLSVLPFLYEDYYKCAEDYKFWATIASRKLTIYSESHPVIYYRFHDGSISHDKQNIMWRTTDIIKNVYNTKRGGELTCIIPFQNEGQEIERTVASIRGTTKRMNIMLVNDCSTDGYDYKFVADLYDCDYIETETNLGVAGCRDFAINKCSTEYFLLLDGHMRFYDLNWDNRFLQELKNRKNAIVTGNTLVSRYNYDTLTYKNEYQFDYKPVPYRAATMCMETGEWFTGKWTNNELPQHKDQNVIPIACCMGAVYGSNKTWWKHINGLTGLSKWGQDEPYMSLKTWLAGGEVLLMKDWCVGHMYRDSAAYLVPSDQRLRNRIFLTEFFLKDDKEIKEKLNDLREKVGHKWYDEAMVEFDKIRDEFNEWKSDFWDNIAVRDLNWYFEKINKPIININKKKEP